MTQKKSSIRNFEIKEKTLNEKLKNSYLILDHAHEAAKTLLGAFDIVKKKRKGGSIGGTTDQEQDLLRSMLVLVAAGIDSMTKELIRNSLKIVLKKNKNAEIEFHKFVNRKLRLDAEDGSFKEVQNFLTSLIVADSLQDQAIAEYVLFLTSNSLQSTEEMIRAIRALGIGQDEVSVDAEELKRIFVIRNHIIHELDVLFGAPKRSRRVRKQALMIKSVNSLLELGEKILVSVSRQMDK